MLPTLGALTRAASRRLQTALRIAGERIGQDAADAVEILKGRHDPLTPPRRMWSMVGDSRQDFAANGRVYVDFLVEASGLGPHGKVLDIGCGVGKHAAPFARYLKPPGAYEGFDIDRRGIDWCAAAITRRHPHMRFQTAKVRNGCYNPCGEVSAREYSFPYTDDEFDLAFAASVFTHMYLADVVRYAQEIGRVLKPGGRAIVSAFLLNENRRAAIGRGNGTFSFGHAAHESWTEFPARPEAAVAFDEPRFLAAFEAAGLRPYRPIQYAFWAEAPNHQGQDIAFFAKP